MKHKLLMTALLCGACLIGIDIHANTVTDIEAEMSQTVSVLTAEQSQLESEIGKINSQLATLKSQYEKETVTLVSVTKEIVELEESDSTVSKIKLADSQNEFNKIKSHIADLETAQEHTRQKLADVSKQLEDKKKEIETAPQTVGQYYAKYNGTDQFSAELIDHAFEYYGKGVIYTQSGARGSITWNQEKTDVLGGYLDCSSFVLTVMANNGLNVNRLGTTETLFSYDGTVLQAISREEATTGDIFVVGTPGQSLGNGGHTGIFLNNSTVIHSSVQNADNGGSGNVYVQEYPSNHFDLQPQFYRIVR